MPFLLNLSREAFHGVHPLHHVFHLFGREDVAIGVAEGNVCQLADEGNVLQGGLSYLHKKDEIWKFVSWKVVQR